MVDREGRKERSFDFDASDGERLELDMPPARSAPPVEVAAPPRRERLSGDATYRSPAKPIVTEQRASTAPTPPPIERPKVDEDANRAKRMSLLFLGLALLAALPLVRCAWQSRTVMTYRSERALAPHVARLTPAVVTVTESKEREKYVKGRLVVIDVDATTIDPAFHSLPLELLPKDASDVGSVAWVSCKNVPASGVNPATGVPVFGHVSECHVRVVDWSIARVVAKGHFESFIAGTAETPTRPTLAIAGWLASLPRR